MTGYVGYFGPYEIDEKAQAVVHLVEGAWYPNYRHNAVSDGYAQGPRNGRIEAGEMTFMRQNLTPFRLGPHSSIWLVAGARMSNFEEAGFHGWVVK